MLGENSLQWIICYLEVLYAEGVIVTLDIELLGDDTCTLVNRMDPVLILSSSTQIDKLKQIGDSSNAIVLLQDIDKMITTLAALPELMRADPNYSNDYDENVATIVNSSGTGEAKRNFTYASKSYRCCFILQKPIHH